MIHLHLQIASSCKLSNRCIDLISLAKTVTFSVEAWYNELVVFYRYGTAQFPASTCNCSQKKHWSCSFQRSTVYTHCAVFVSSSNTVFYKKSFFVLALPIKQVILLHMFEGRKWDNCIYMNQMFFLISVTREDVVLWSFHRGCRALPWAFTLIPVLWGWEICHHDVLSLREREHRIKTFWSQVQILWATSCFLWSYSSSSCSFWYLHSTS